MSGLLIDLQAEKALRAVADLARPIYPKVTLAKLQQAITSVINGQSMPTSEMENVIKSRANAGRLDSPPGALNLFGAREFGKHFARRSDCRDEA